MMYAIFNKESGQYVHPDRCAETESPEWVTDDEVYAMVRVMEYAEMFEEEGLRLAVVKVEA